MEKVSLPNSFFVKSCRDYSEPRGAYLREFIQNSRDAGATEIHLSVVDTPEGIRFECRDNGCGMDEDTLRNKLMALGETSKTGAAGVTGGFGVAKILIFFAQTRYKIRSRNFVAEGEGGSYHVQSGLPEAVGVCAEVILNREVFNCDLESLCRLWVNELSRSKLTPAIFLNGEKVMAEKGRGRLYQTLEWCRVYRKRIPVSTYVASVRCNGLHMFDLHLAVSLPWDVIIEVDGFSTEVFTTNRDGFKLDHQEKLLNVLADLESGRPSKQNEQVSFRYHAANRLVGEEDVAQVLAHFQNQQEAGGINLSGVASSLGSAFNYLSPTKVQALARQVMDKSDSEAQRKVIEAFIEGQHDFAIEVLGKNRLPAGWQPERFSRRIEALRHMWREICEMVADHIQHDDAFTTGFVLDYQPETDTIEGLQINHKVGKPAVYINPSVFLEYAKGVSPEAAMLRMISVATHEICHLMGTYGHGEQFVSREIRIRSRVYENLGMYLERAEFWYQTLFPGKAKKARVFREYFGQLALF